MQTTQHTPAMQTTQHTPAMQTTQRTPAMQTTQHTPAIQTSYTAYMLYYTIWYTSNVQISSFKRLSTCCYKSSDKGF